MMPSRLRAALEHRRARPVLAFDGAEATLWRPAQSDGRTRMIEAARIALDGDPQAVVAGGRSALAPLVRGGNGAAPEVVIALAPRAILRKTACAAGGDRSQPAPGARLRSRPSYAVQVRRALFRRRRRRSRSRAQHAAASSSPPRAAAIVDPMLRHAESFGARVVGVSRRPARSHRVVAPQPAARRPSGARIALARWQVACPALLVIAAILAALVLPVWQKREEAIALNQQSRPGAAAGRRVRRAAHRARAQGRRIQLRARAQVRLSGHGAGARRRHAPAARRHVAHAARAAQRPRARTASAS